MIERSDIKTLIKRLRDNRRYIQVIVGPRQVGKTTLVKQTLKKITIPFQFYSAENVFQTQGWIAQVWQSARQEMIVNHHNEFLLIIDEIQKIPNWSEQIKQEWDKDTWNDLNLKVIILGSSRLLIMNGLTESLAGRFELIRMTHWSFSEMNEAFGWDLPTYIYYGGYPGAADFIKDENRWRFYVEDALLEAAINKDVLQTSNIYKPALLRQLFQLACAYSGKELSLRKAMGQMQDAGNATTLTSYLSLLSEAELVTGLQKFAFDIARKYNSSPKFQVFNNALMNVYNQTSFQQVLLSPQLWGRQVESAIGAHILNQAHKNHMQVYYWRDGNAEVDFVVQYRQEHIAIEVKSNNERMNKGLATFSSNYHPKSAFIVGNEGLPIESFLKTDLKDLF